MTFKERSFICKDGHVSKHWAWDNEPPMRCRTRGCRLRAHRALPGSLSFAQNSQPFVYYKNPTTGEIFIAATAADRRRPRAFSQRCELRTMRDYSRFRAEHAAKLRDEAELNHELDRADRAACNRANRERLTAMMSAMSPAGQAMARAAIERSYADDAPPMQPADCFVQGIELDRSERQPWNDAESGYRRRD